MPEPKAGESRSDYLARCIPSVMKEKGKTQDQAKGQCVGMWNQHVKNQLQLLSVNIQGDLVRDETMGGEEYWVAPMVPMVEAVATGSLGALYYPARELEKWAPSWNHKPIVAPCHPESGSACTKEFLDKHSIGVVLNSVWDGKHRAEGWFNKKRTRLVEPRVANALQTRRTTELSTGLFVDLDGEPGEFDGKAYDAVATNHRPDHLAILPDKIGAFSIKMGAGLLQLNEASHEQIRNQIDALLLDLHRSDMETHPSLYQPYVREVYDGFAIYYFGGNLYKISYSVSSDDKVSLVGDPTQVEQKVDYVPVSNAEDKHEEDTMPKKELIDKIISNSAKTNFVEGDRKYLEGLDEKRLESFAKMADAKEAKNEGLPTTKEEFDVAVTRTIEDIINKNPEDLKKKAEEAISKNQKKDPPPAPPSNLTPEQWMSAMPNEFKHVFNNMGKAYKDQVQQLITTITANKSNTMKPEDLVKLDLDVLRNMAMVAAPTPDPNQQTNVVNPMSYIFAGPVPQAQNSRTIKEEGMPVPEFDNSRFSILNTAKK